MNIDEIIRVFEIAESQAIEIAKILFWTNILIRIAIFILIIYLIVKFIKLCKDVQEIREHQEVQTKILNDQNDILLKIGQMTVNIENDIRYKNKMWKPPKRKKN